jgi:hypothetical protein
MAQWAATAEAALQRGAASVHADEAARAAQDKTAADAKAAKKQEAGEAMIGGALAAETDEAMMAKVDEAEAAKSSKEAMLVDAGKVVAETTSALPQTGD